jgi:hypothetical protein
VLPLLLCVAHRHNLGLSAVMGCGERVVVP